MTVLMNLSSDDWLNVQRPLTLLSSASMGQSVSFEGRRGSWQGELGRKGESGRSACKRPGSHVASGSRDSQAESVTTSEMMPLWLRKAAPPMAETEALCLLNSHMDHTLCGDLGFL